VEIAYRVLETIEELEQVVDLEMLVWDLPARDATPSGLLHAMVNNGSLVVGAYDNQVIVGMALMFPSSQHNHTHLWSHMAAVHPNYQGQGIGFGLKQFQRIWALENGYNSMGWTFDPLQRGNANFNLHVLGATANIYHVNYYGDLTDGLNAGLPSDRLETTWSLKAPRVKQLSQKKSPTPLVTSGNISNFHFLLRRSQENLQLNAFPVVPQFCLAEIPQNVNHLKHEMPELALKWRLALRDTMQHAFAAGYTAHDLVTIEDRPYYALMPTERWYLYVLECADQTLYTGISPNLARRLKLHNSGRGAAYTKTRRPVKLLGAWVYRNRQEALKAEFAFKQLQRSSKLKHITQKLSFQDAAFVESDT